MGLFDKLKGLLFKENQEEDIDYELTQENLQDNDIDWPNIDSNQESAYWNRDEPEDNGVAPNEAKASSGIYWSADSFDLKNEEDSFENEVKATTGIAPNTAEASTGVYNQEEKLLDDIKKEIEPNNTETQKANNSRKNKFTR